MNKDLPTVYVNTMSVQPVMREVFLTLGITLPVVARQTEDLARLDTMETQPVFQCVVTREVAHAFVEMMQRALGEENERKRGEP